MALQTETMVREYDDTDEYNRDAKKLAEQGWSVQSVTELSQSSGCFRCCFLGIFAAILKPKSHLVVTYVRNRQ
jgi:hypothetical protein